MRLVIAEKPSVARSIAAVIGADKKQKGYLEGNDYLVSWCVGHLVELAAPATYDAKYAKWRAEDLPILPDPWQYSVAKATKPQYNILHSLMNSRCVTDIICATDAGREGELIFRLVYSVCECMKPVQRLWISSMEEAAIAEGFRALKPASEYDRLYHAALCRAQADWLVGINATRLFSTLYQQTLHIGRVMTPTLAMIVEREVQIAAFQSASFYTVQLDCGFLTAASERLTDRAEAGRIAGLCNSGEARISKLESKDHQEKPPMLYDLTSLQRDANRLLGYTAQQTLDYAQALYEKKLATYPRTDSRYLTSHMADNIQALVDTVKNALPFPCNDSLCCNVSQVVDDSKVSDHHAMIPTAVVNHSTLAALPVGERSILILLMVRLLSTVANPCHVTETIAMLECKGVLFIAKGRQVTDMGWKSFYKSYLATLKDTPADASDDVASQALPALNDQLTFLPVGTSVKEGRTSPPKSYTEATLLSAMETAGKEDMPDDAERKGLGTPATRAGMIEKLVKVGLIERKRNKKGCILLPTQKGASLITVLPEELQSPQLTAEWEQKLKRMERGDFAPDAFMRNITEMVRTLTQDSHPIPEGGVLFADTRKSIGVCPRCGSAVLEGSKGFTCSNRDCRFALWRNNRFFAAKKKELTTSIATVLLKDGRVPMKGLFSPKTGKTYDATVVMNDTGGQYINFRLEFGGKSNGKR